jgi:hypothetical protein
MKVNHSMKMGSFTVSFLPAFIEIQDLLAEVREDLRGIPSLNSDSFQFPDTASRAVMDIKIGTRTFLESEVSNGNKRADLYRKMVGLAPDEPTEQASNGIISILECTISHMLGTCRRGYHQTSVGIPFLFQKNIQ